MSNLLYPLIKQAMLSPGIDLVNNAIKAMLVSTKSTNGAGNFYTYSAAHQFLSDVVAGSRLTPGIALTTKTVVGGVFNADGVTFTAVTGNEADFVLLYLDTGTESTSRLLAYIDTLTGFPLTPSGADIQVLWDTGVNKIFAL